LRARFFLAVVQKQGGDWVCLANCQSSKDFKREIAMGLCLLVSALIMSIGIIVYGTISVVMIVKYVQKIEPKLKECIDRLQSHLNLLPSGRASPELLDTMQVTTSYGGKMPIRGVASTVALDKITLKVTPFDKTDKSLTGAIVEGVSKSTIGLTAYVEGAEVIVKLSEHSSERKKELKRAAQEEGEKTKRHIRDIRHDCLKNAEKEIVAEDEKYRLRDDLNELVKKYCKDADALVAEKARLFE
jgi:ribosome recycling factor